MSSGAIKLSRFKDIRSRKSPHSSPRLAPLFNPGHLTGAIRMAGGEPSRAVMVGDSDVDVRTAKAASVPVVVVSFGYAGPPPSGAPPEAVIDHFDKLHGSLASLLRGTASRRTRSHSA